MDAGPEDDGLTEELAAQMRADLEAETGEERREHVALRRARDGTGVELVLFADDVAAVVTTLAPPDARALAAALLALAGDA